MVDSCSMGEALLGSQGSVRLMTPMGWGRALWAALRLWFHHDCVDLSAAFAYHAMQSVFPIGLIALSLASRVLGQDEGLVDRLLSGAQQVLPGTAMPAVTSGLNAFLRQGVGAGLLGVVVLVLTASNAYLTLQRGADRIWWDRPDGLGEIGWRRLLWRYCALRLKALALMGLLALVIVMDRLAYQWSLPGSLVLRDLLPTIFPRMLDLQQPFDLGVGLLSTLGFSLLASLLLLWMLPSRHVPWRDLLPGAGFLAASFTVLNLLLGRVLVALGLRFQAYGLVGGVLVFGLWVWLIGVLIYYSQCLSVVIRRPRRGRP